MRLVWGPPWLCAFFCLLLLAALAAPLKAESKRDERSDKNSLELPALEQLGIEHSPVIMQARASRDAAKARQMQAQSGFWPQLGLQGASYRARNERNTVSGSSSESRQSQEAGLYFSQTLFDYSLWFRSQSAGFTAMAFDEQARMVINDVLNQVRQAYFAVRIAEQLLQVAEQARADTEAFRDKVRILMESGLVPQLDLARAEYDLAEAERRVIEAKSSLRKQYARLAYSVGLNDLYYASLSGRVVAREEALSISEEALLLLGLKFRPEIKQADYFAQAAAAAVDEAKGGHLPVLSLQGNAGQAGESGLDHGVYSYGLYLDMPLFQGFRVQGLVLEYEALYRVALQDLALARLGVVEEIHVAYQNLQEALAKVKVSQNQVSTAEENWRLVESRYQAGLATPLELSEARTNRFSALATLASDRITVLASLSSLDRACGGALFPFIHQRQGSGDER